MISLETRKKMSIARTRYLRVNPTKNNYYKHGKSLYQHYCLDCNKKIDWRAKRCKSCSLKVQPRGAVLLDKSGSNNPCYRNGCTPLHILIRCCDKNIQWIKTILKRDNYKCCECGIYAHDLEAHHIKTFSNLLKQFLKKYSMFSPNEDKETLLRLSFSYKPFWRISNGKTLCKECHKKQRRIK